MNDPVWRNSQSLARQLAHALSRPVDLAQRPRHRVSVGQTLINTRDAVAHLPFVMSGRLNAVVHIPGQQGGQIVPIAFGPGEIALLSYLFNRLPSGSDLVAAQASTIQWIPVEDIEKALLRDPQMMVLLVSFLGLRLREVQARERAGFARNVPARLSASLSRIVMNLPSRTDGRLLIQATHEQLAASCGVSRPKTSLALKKMERDGIVLLGRKWVEVLNTTALQALAN
ncbi:Crp/Fnr family transcriptional regulator [Limnohabitans sp. Bal53]|uniref:Crp/Fnr family transcriptional regulator n=1 Tax=Limnohabitans sp. Bal53 TaxID=1977910 RepID=UPI001304CDBE|nr:Crp/Fnr family transcriptional regulator [Limnohabitans sp. Bal53]